MEPASYIKFEETSSTWFVQGLKATIQGWENSLRDVWYVWW